MNLTQAESERAKWAEAYDKSHSYHHLEKLKDATTKALKAAIKERKKEQNNARPPVR